MGLASAHFKRMWLDGKRWSRGTVFGQASCETPAVPLPPSSPSASQAKIKRLQQQRGWVKTYTRQDGEASAGLQDCPVKVRPTPQVLRSLVGKIHSRQAPGTYSVTRQMCSHLGRCANGTESLSVPGMRSEKMLLSHPAPIPTCSPLPEGVPVVIGGSKDQHSH